MFSKVELNEIEEPKGFVSFTINERIQRILMWINNNFILAEDLASEGSINIAFIALRTNKPLVMKMDPNGQIIFKTDDIELAGLLIQSLISFLNIIDLQVSCDFPEELENLLQILVKVIKSFKIFILIFNFKIQKKKD